MRIAIEKLVHGGHGLGIESGRAIFVPYAAPGDELEVSLVEDRGGARFGRIDQIVVPAACRVEPPCPHFGSCGGCQWQHLSYDAQLFWKRAILAEALERIGKVPAPLVQETLAAPDPWHYRNRVQLHVDSAGRVGYYRPRSKEVVEFEECLIAEESINRELAARRNELSSRSRGIALRLASGEGFSQVNTAQNLQLAELLCAWLAELPRAAVLELYAGDGNFTFALARVADHVTASDIDGRAVRAAQLRMERERATNVQFACMPADRAARRYGRGCDAVIVDPPRKGCDDAVAAIVEVQPAAILYISCDPATLARDVRAFAAQGYRFVRSQPVDMFPQTFHVESLSLLVRG